MDKDPFRYISLFSGVEAASVAWHPLGWEPVAFAEFDKFPSAVLAHHYPDVPNVGDVTQHDWKQYEGKVDLVVGGSPCQSFSVAGKRLGMDDPRGNLALEYLRVIRDVKPRWFLYENVPGLLSSGGGRDFGAFLGEVEKLGYGWSYRILDARFFGVPQRRRRVFLVGCAGGDWNSAGTVLLEPEGESWDTTSSDEEGQEPPEIAGDGSTQESGSADGRSPSASGVIPYTLSGFASYVQGIGTLKASGGDLGGGSETLLIPFRKSRRAQSKTDDETWVETEHSNTLNNFDLGDVRTTHAIVYENHAQDSRIKAVDVAPAIPARAGTGGGNLPLVDERPQGVDLYNQTMTGDIHVPLRTAGGHGAPAVAEPIGFHAKQNPIHSRSHFPAMGAGEGVIGVAEPSLGIPGNWIGRKPENGGNATKPMVDTAPCLTRTDTHAVAQVVAPTLTAANNPSRSPQSTEVTSQIAAVHEATMTVRKLTPLECERLQGFPDNYTRIPWKGKAAEDCPLGHRYKAMGNSMAVPVMAWIGRRIEALRRL